MWEWNIYNNLYYISVEKVFWNLKGKINYEGKVIG